MNAQQLPLGFGLRDDATFNNYIPEGNVQVFNSIIATVQAKGEDFIYIWGAEGSGRSHLLQASCHAAPEFGQTAFYLPLAQGNLGSDLFNGLENIALICIDDIDQIAGSKLLEEQLFHLFNRVRAKGNRLIIAADVPPTQLKIELADLKSRLSWGTVYQLEPLDDEQKLKLLCMRAFARGLELDDSVAKFLLRRCSRKMTQLFSLLDQLDQASLSKQRRLTIPFVKDVLGL